jgi:DNA-binding MarR family transcriptional regulator
LDEISNALGGAQLAHMHAPAPVKAVSPPRPPRSTPPPTNDGEEIKLGKTERSILTALVQHGGLTNNQLALLTGYSAKASTISVSLGKLRRWDLVLTGQPIQATAKGIDLIGDDVEPLPKGQALIDYWRNRFGLTERKVLDVFLAVHPKETYQAEVADRTGYSPSASTISVALGKLRRVGVIEKWHLSDDFVSACGLG